MTEKTLYDYWMICYRRRLTIWVMLITAVVGAVVISGTLPAIYEARAMFYVPTSATTSRSNAGDSDIPLPASNQDDAKANIGILKGRDALRTIHEKFPQRSMDALQRNVDFTAGRDGIIHVYVRDRDPKLAADIANAYVAHFNRFLILRMQQRSSPKVDAIKARIADLSVQIQDVVKRRNELAAITGTPSLDVEALELVREREGMHKELDELNGALAATDSKQSSSDKTVRELTPAIEDLEKQLSQIDIDLAKARQRTLPNHPDQIALIKSREVVVAALQEKRKALSTLDKTRAGTVNTMLQKRNQRLKAIPEYQSRLNEMDQQYRDLRAALSLLKNNLEEATLAGLKSAQVGIMVETAMPPEIPVFPIMWLNIIIAAVVSALAGMLYALLLDYIDERRSAAAAPSAQH